MVCHTIEGPNGRMRWRRVLTASSETPVQDMQLPSDIQPARKEKEKEKERSMPLGIMMGASVPRSSLRLSASDTCPTDTRKIQLGALQSSKLTMWAL